MKGRFTARFSTKLVVSLFSVVLISQIGSILISRHIIQNNVLGQAYEEVRSHLNAAQHMYAEEIRVLDLFVKHLSSLGYVQAAVLEQDRARLTAKLDEVRKELNLDVLTITDGAGVVLARARGSGGPGEEATDDLFVRSVLREHRAFSGTDVVGDDQLRREGERLAEQAFIRLVPTPRARKLDKPVVTSGMCLKAAAPIFSEGRFIGVVYGARLLNNNFELVDRIKRLLFKDERIGGFEMGTVTIFMDDIRISTNVQDNQGRRAVGTQVSEEVYRRVVGQRQVWLRKAFVVNNWYISGYSPIHDIEQKVIGILYVGILEEKYNLIKRNAMLYALLVTLMTAVVAGVLAVYLTRSITTPIRSLVAASRGIAKGDHDRRIPVTSADEMGYLCMTFNRMVEAIAERDRKLKERTEMQIVQSEKLASLGRLASGIAHEINNPLTGVLSYGTALYDELKGSDYAEDLKVIIDETLRCREIVKGILDFARETSIEKRPHDLDRIISETLAILQKHVSFHDVRIRKNLAGNLPQISVDANQMRSVINNLVVNAADAMHNEGDLSIATEYDRDRGRIIITVADTGVGISPENMGKIYDPFFTTKETGKGTGLGLAVVYGVVQRHNGTIRAESTVGAGTTFTIELPVDGQGAPSQG